jgi:hypothetical protein
MRLNVKARADLSPKLAQFPAQTFSSRPSPNPEMKWLALNRQTHSEVSRSRVVPMIEDQVTRSRIVGKGLTQLLNNPRAGWMSGYVEVDDAPPAMGDDEKAVKDAKSERRRCEEIHCSSRFAMIFQKRHPSLRRLGISRSLSHPAQYGSFRNVEVQHLQLTVNAWRAPSAILRDHVKDQFPQFPADTLSPHALAMPGEPGPIEPEACSMSANNSLGLKED